MVTVYCFTGYPAAGKSVANSVARSLGLPVVSMGDIVREMAEAEGVDSVGDWATQHRKEHSNDIFARYTRDRIKEKTDSDVVVVDGLRTINEKTVFEEAFESVVVVFISAPFEIRLERFQSRRRDDEDLRKRDIREGKWGLDKLLDEQAYHVMLHNDGSLETFENKVEAVLMD